VNFDFFRDALLGRRAAIERDALARMPAPEGGGAVGQAKTAAPPLSDAERHEVAEIDAALKRIERGSFGHCEDCDAAIGWHRLRAVPEGRRCDTCELAASPPRRSRSRGPR
jgi:DnaK suppressor protein